MNTWLRLALITMTIGGGFTGVLLTGDSLFHSRGHGPGYIALFALFLALFAYVVASGLLFVLDPQRIQPLLAALAIQIPWVSTPLAVYKFATGAQACFTIGSPREAGNVGFYFGWYAQMGTTFKVAWGQDIPWDIGVNLGALLLFILLWRSTRTPVPISQPVVSVPADARID